MRRLVALVMLMPCVVTAGCGGGGGGGGPKAFDVTGALGLRGDLDSVAYINLVEGDFCMGTGGYDDIAEGTQVTIRDDSGKKVALGKLKAGKLGNDPTNDDLRCGFLFEISGVPGGSKIYSVEVSHRGEIDFTKANADSLVLTLG